MTDDERKKAVEQGMLADGRCSLLCKVTDGQKRLLVKTFVYSDRVRLETYAKDSSDGDKLRKLHDDLLLTPEQALEVGMSLIAAARDSRRYALPSQTYAADGREQQAIHGDLLDDEAMIHLPVFEVARVDPGDRFPVGTRFTCRRVEVHSHGGWGDLIDPHGGPVLVAEIPRHLRRDDDWPYAMWCVAARDARPLNEKARHVLLAIVGQGTAAE